MADPSADLEGAISPPRRNGEVVFAAPWERRVFGLAVALCRTQTCEWERFRQRLIQRVAVDESVPYWENWAAALEDVLADQSLVARSELDERHRDMRNRPAGHDQ